MSDGVEIQLDGKKYSATYEVKRGVIEVSSFWGRRTTQTGGMATKPEILARQLLREIVSDAKAAGHLE